MSIPKILAILLLIAGAAVAYQMIAKEKCEPPPNERVNEQKFDELRAKMTATQVESILGSPHRTAGGEIVQLERPGSPDLQGTIHERPCTPGGNKMNVYQGRNEESIEVLFSAKEEVVIAAEYHVSDHPVIYRGPRVAKRSEDLLAVSIGQSAGPDKKQKQQENVARYERRKTLEKRAGTSLFGSAEPTSTSPPASPPPTTPIPPKSDTSQKQSVQRRSPADQPSAPAAVPSNGLPLGNPTVVAPAVGTNAARNRSGPFRIELPSGKVLTASLPTFELPRPWPDKLFPKGAVVFVARDSKDAVRGVFTLSKAKLHGASATVYASGHLHTAAFYAEGRLHGPVRIWTEQKERLLYAEYKNGNKHGLICLYRERAPWLLQEWDNAKLEAEYLVSYAGATPTVLPSSNLAEHTDDLAAAQRQIEDLEENIRREQNKIKADAADWTRKEDKKIKQRRIAELASGRYQPTTHTNGEANTAAASKLEMRWRAALHNSKY